MGDASFITSLIDEIDKVFQVTLGSDLFTKAANLISGIAPVFGLGFSVYVLLVVWQLYRSGLDEMVINSAKPIIGWMIIIAFAFNASQYATLASAIYTFPDELSALVTGSDISNSALKTGIVNVLKVGGQMLAWAIKKLGLTDIVVPLVTMLVAMAVTALGMVAFLLLWFYYLVTKVSLALVLLVGPLFLGAMLFPSTRQYGMNWIGQCLNYSVTIALFATISTLQISFIEQRMLIVQSKVANISTLFEVFNILIFFAIFTVIAIIVALNIPNIAQALTGGTTVESGVRKLASTVSPAVKVANKLRGK